MDALFQVLGIECCWIQTISDRENQKLALAAERGFSPDMKSEISAMDLTHKFTGQIIGICNKIVIPDLNNDGLYGLASFRKAGYRWLVAVPLMTYRAYGLLGAASKNKRLMDKDTARLIMVIGGLIANSLGKAHFTPGSAHRSKLPDVLAIKPDKAALTAQKKKETEPATPSVNTTPQSAPAVLPLSIPPSPPPAIPVPVLIQKANPAEKIPISVRPSKPVNPPDPAFHSHTRKMESFRRAHKQEIGGRKGLSGK